MSLKGSLLSEESSNYQDTLIPLGNERERRSSAARFGGVAQLVRANSR